MVKDREAWRAAVHGVAEGRARLRVQTATGDWKLADLTDTFLNLLSSKNFFFFKDHCLNIPHITYPFIH